MFERLWRTPPEALKGPLDLLFSHHLVDAGQVVESIRGGLRQRRCKLLVDDIINAAQMAMPGCIRGAGIASSARLFIDYSIGKIVLGHGSPRKKASGKNHQKRHMWAHRPAPPPSARARPAPPRSGPLLSCLTSSPPTVPRSKCTAQGMAWVWHDVAWQSKAWQAMP